MCQRRGHHGEPWDGAGHAQVKQPRRRYQVGDLPAEGREREGRGETGAQQQQRMGAGVIGAPPDGEAAEKDQRGSHKPDGTLVTQPGPERVGAGQADGDVQHDPMASDPIDQRSRCSQGRPARRRTGQPQIQWHPVDRGNYIAGSQPWPVRT